MTIWQTIRDDHDKVELLFERIDESDDEDERAKLIAELDAELEAHAAGEEQAVYPELQKIDALKLKIAHSREEHDEVRQLLKRVAAADEDERTSLLAELEEAVQDHVEEEEDEIIPIAEDEIEDEQAAAMLRRFEAAKKAVAKS